MTALVRDIVLEQGATFFLTLPLEPDTDVTTWDGGMQIRSSYFDTAEEAMVNLTKGAGLTFKEDGGLDITIDGAVTADLTAGAFGRALVVGGRTICAIGHYDILLTAPAARRAYQGRVFLAPAITR